MTFSWRSGILLIWVATGQAANAEKIKFVGPSGGAVANAQVLIGTSPGVPFAGNQLNTSSMGEIEIPPAWTGPAPLSIEATGHVKTTYALVSPLPQTLRVSEADGSDKIELKGELTNFGRLRTDGKLDVGAFIPTFSREELLYFDVGWMVSPEVDTFTVVGREVAVPSNITIPEQQESYIFPITFNKPSFRMFVRKPGRYRFLAIHGQFPLQRVVDDMRAGKPPYDIINHANLLESGRVDLNVTGPVAQMNVSVTGVPFNSTMTVKAPTLNSEDVMLTVALTEDSERGLLIPSDVKRIRSLQSFNLRIPATAAAPMAVSVLLKEKKKSVQATQTQPLTPDDVLQIPFDVLYRFFNTATNSDPLVDFRQFSLATHPANGDAPQFLDLVPALTISGNRIQAKAPRLASLITPLATLLIYSGIQYNGSGQLRTESRTRLWEYWQPGWSEEFNLPDLSQLNTYAFDKRRWEVIYLGRNGQIIPREGPYDVSHVTRNAVDF